MVKVFGCPTYYHISEDKLELKTKKDVFMGYRDGVKEFRIWSSSKRKVILSKYVLFDELFMLHSKFEEDLRMLLNRSSLRSL